MIGKNIAQTRQGITKDAKELLDLPPKAQLIREPAMEVPVAEIKELFESFSADQWASIDKRLTRFFYRYYGSEPRLDRNDLIQGAKSALLEGRRHWRPEKVTLVKCLCSAMRSIASHILEKEKRQHTRPLGDSAEVEFSKRDDLAAYHEVCDDLRHLTSGDPVLSRMIEFLIDDPEMKPRNMVESMADLPHKELGNAYRRLNRLIDRLKKERSNGSVS